MKKFLFLIICTLLPLAAWSQLGPQPYAILSDSNSVLTFYYDDLYEARRGAMYVGPFNDEEENVLNVVDKIKNHPLIPDVPVHGLIIDIVTGELKVLKEDY